jgi:hypothetical protein
VSEEEVTQRSTAKFKRPAMASLLLLAVFGAGLLCSRSCNKPPSESKIIADFSSHRIAYERLRDMLLADEQVNAIYVRQDVETKDSGLPHVPSEVNFPASRYNEYRALLEQADSAEVFRAGEGNPGVCISVWASGFGGDTRHVNTCWLQQVPANRVASLDGFYKTLRPHPAFRHIDGDWYLWADW